MILEKQALTLAEVQEIVKDIEEKQALQVYLKKFNKVAKKDVSKLSEEIRTLNNPKIRDEHIIKIIDFLPKDPTEVNKIFTDTPLTEDETKSILDITSRY